MKAGFTRLAHKLARIEARLDAKGDDQNFPIPRHSGMAGLRAAIQAAKEARGDAKYEPPVGEPLGPVASLREDILNEQARRAEWMAALPPNSLGKEPVIEEPIEETDECTAPTTAPPNPSS